MIDLQKFSAPLTITAAVLGIWAFLRYGKDTPVGAGALPLAQPVPSFAAVPSINYNVATPVPPAVTVGTSNIPFTAPAGLKAPAPINPYATGTGATDSGSGSGCCSSCGPTTGNAWNSGISYAQTITQSAVL